MAYINYKKYYKKKRIKRRIQTMFEFLTKIVLFPFHFFMLIFVEIPTLNIKKLKTKLTKKKTTTEKNVEKIYDYFIKNEQLLNYENYIYITPEQYHDYLDFALYNLIIGQNISEYFSVDYREIYNGELLSKEEVLLLIIDKLKEDNTLDLRKVVGIKGFYNSELKDDEVLLHEDNINLKLTTDLKFVSKLIKKETLYKVSVKK